MMREQAEQIIHDALWERNDSTAVDFMSPEAVGEALRAVSPEVLAAAMGGHVETEREEVVQDGVVIDVEFPTIVLHSSREVSRGDR